MSRWLLYVRLRPRRYAGSPNFRNRRSECAKNGYLCVCLMEGLSRVPSAKFLVRDEPVFSRLRARRSGSVVTFASINFVSLEEVRGLRGGLGQT